MSPENELEIERLTESSVLEVMNNKKLKPEIKAKIGMDYLRQTHSMKLNNISTAVRVASLYPEYRREELAKKIIPPKSEPINTEIEYYPKVSIEEVFTAKKEAEQKAQKLENQIADITDEKASKEKSLFDDIKQQEYKQQRELLK